MKPAPSATPEVFVQALAIPQRLAVLSDGSIVPITNFLDAIGDDTDDPTEAVSFVCGSGRQWFSDLLANFEPATFH